MSRQLARLAPLLAILAALCLLVFAGDAFARVGGGQSYGGGSSGGGGSWGGGGGGGDGDLAWFLIWLCIRHPAIGIPVTIVVVIVAIIARSRNQGQRTWTLGHGPGTVPMGPPAPRRAAPVRVEAVQAVDPNFSLPAFLDFASVVHARAHQERTRDLSVLGSFLPPAVQEALRVRSAGQREVRDVILGALRLAAVRVERGAVDLTVHFEANLTEVTPGGEEQVLVTERWTFRKAAGSLSPPPERLVALACPSCGNPAETRTDGTCVHCDAPVGGGRVLWQVVRVEVRSREPVRPPPLGFGGVERGTDLPTVYDPGLPVQVRAFQGRHPEFDFQRFKAWVADTFRSLQAAWDAGRWEQARAHQTDALFQTHRYWMERYRKFGLRNRLEDVAVLEVVPVKVSSDAFYESITVRIKARMKDWTEDKEGNVVGGSRHQARTFSEYWTFIRTAGKQAEPHAAPDACPSCGAPLDRMSQAGICGYCGAKVTSGDFDWVLSSIEQDEAYHG